MAEGFGERTSRPSMALMVALLPEPAMPSTSTVMENGSSPSGSAASAAWRAQGLGLGPFRQTSSENEAPSCECVIVLANCHNC